MSTPNPMFDEYFQRSAFADSGGGKRNPHFREGRYEVTITDVFVGKKEGGFMVIPELLVDRCEPSAPGVTPNEVGTKFSFVWMFDHPTAGKMAPGNTQQFIVAIEGMTVPMHPSKGGNMEKFAEFATSYKKFFSQLGLPEQPARGIRLKVESYNSKGFVGPNWTHVPGQTGDSIAARRAELDAAGL